MQAQFQALQAQVAALNTQLATMINSNKAVDPSGFNKLAKAAEINSRVWRDAAASTGLFQTQQVQLNSATDEYVKKLKAQKMGFREMRAYSKVATAAYKEQLAMQQMIVRSNPAGTRHGRDVFDVMYPNAYAKSLDNLANRAKWMNMQLKSGANQLVNWGKNTQWAGRQLTVGLTMPVMAFGAAAGAMAYQVDKEFTRIAKVYDTQANKLEDLAGWEAEVSRLREDGYETARMAAREYQSAITDTLQVQAELAATGQTGLDLQKNTAEVMRISTLGELEHNVATEAAIALQQIWGQSSSELADTFNYLNAIENATSLTTEDFATAIPIASAAVKSFGGDIQELGILMTAMRERGIAASEGANALKATMQRLSRPSKQIRQEFQALTGQSIVELVDSSDGLIDIFTKLNDITSELDANAKRDVFAGLFGSYQVARMSALTEGMGSLQNGVGQVSRAAEIAGQSTADWAKTADSEIKALQQSISGQFKAAVEELKGILAELGIPFLKAATEIIQAVTKLVGWVNDLSDGWKNFIGIAISAAAVAGPIIMLIGLFGNLAGMIMKMAAGGLGMFLSFANTIGFASKESRIFNAVSKHSQSNTQTLAVAMKDLTVQAQALAAAQVAANTASKEAQLAMGQELQWTKKLSAAHKERTAQLDLEARAIKHFGRQINEAGDYRLFNSAGKYMNLDQAKQDIQHVGRVTDKDQAHAQALAIESRRRAESERIARAEARSAAMMRLGSVAAAATSASMAATMFSSNKTVETVANWTMALSIAGPAVLALGNGMKVAAVAAAAYAKSMWSAAAAAQLQGKSLTGTIGKKLFSSVKALGKGNLAMLALAAVAAGAYKVWDHFRDIRVEQERIDKANGNLLGQTERWAEATGKTLSGYKQLAAVSKAGANSTDMTKRIEFYKSDDEKEATESFGDMDYGLQDITLAQKYLDMVVGMKMGVKDAQKELQAFLIASGEGFVQAKVRAAGVADELEHIAEQASKGKRSAAWLSQWEDTMAQMSALDPVKQDDTAESLGQNAGKAWAQAFLNGTDGMKSNMIEDLKKRIFNPWDRIVAEMAEFKSTNLEMATENENFIADSLNMDIEKFREATTSGEKFRAMYMALDKDGRETLKSLSPFDEAIEQAEALERAIVGGIAEALGVAAGGVDTIGELLQEAAVIADTLSLEIGGIGLDTDGFYRRTTDELDVAQGKIMEYWKDIMGKETWEMGDREAFEDKLTDYQVKPGDWDEWSQERKDAWEAEAEQIREMVVLLKVFEGKFDLQEAKTTFGSLNHLFNEFFNDTDTGISKISKLDAEMSKLGDVQLSVDIMVNMYKDVRGGIQETMADMMTEDFDQRMQADQDRVQSYWDNRRDALDRQMQNRSDALDRKWEGRKEEIEKLIEAEEKAEDKRQKMFEAEMERIDRLADAYNKNVDFNVALNEGNLDEAAKLANDMEAEESNFLLDKAAEASQDASDAEIERLNAKKDAMAKAEDAEKAHLDKITDMRKKALDKQADDAIAANKADWDTKKKAFDEQMTLFLAFTARNEEELKKHMEDVGIGYDQFGEILKKKGTNWSTFMGDEMQKQVRLAALQLRDDHVWSEMASGTILAFAKAMGFPSVNSFKHFVKTGEYKDLKDGQAGGASANDGTRLPGKEKQGGVPGVGGAHEGGWAGKTGNNRTGVARTYKGLHQSEVMIRAQKGEFVVNRDVAKKHGPLLETLNETGQFPHNKATARAGRAIGGGGTGPFAPMAAATMMRATAFGLGKLLNKNLTEAKKRGASTGAFPGKFVEGQGGWHKPSIPGLGWSNDHDYRAKEGTPIFAASDAVVTKSHAITSGGGTTFSGSHPGQYTSYGETIQLRLADGNLLNYAHLMPGGRYVTAGQKVKGGALIGRTGWTGNASGPHLHLDYNGNYNARGYLASRGIPLDKGAANVNFDNVPAILHKNEAVLTEDINRQFRQGVANFANGSNGEYTFIVNPSEGMDEEALARKAINMWKAEMRRQPQSRTIGNRSRP